MTKKAVFSMVAGGFAAAAVATAIAFAAPAAAQSGGQAVALGQTAVRQSAVGQVAMSQDVSDRPAYCDHIDKALDKRQAMVARIEGDANTRGSLAWLNERVATATAEGNAELAMLFTDRAALRTVALEPLKTITADLAAVQQAHCN